MCPALNVSPVQGHLGSHIQSSYLEAWERGPSSVEGGTVRYDHMGQLLGDLLLCATLRGSHSSKSLLIFSRVCSCPGAAVTH